MSRALPRPRRVLAICNPESGRLRNTPGVLDPVLDRVGAASVRHCITPDAIEASVRELDPSSVDTLLVIGGDGTAQAVLTALHRNRPDGCWPMLLPVPAGSTNMTASDLGAPRTLDQTVGPLLRWLADEGDGARVVERAALLLEREGRAPLCGLFFGAGLISQGVRFFREHLREVPLKSERTSWLSIARVLFTLGTSGAERAGAQRVRVAIDGGAPQGGLLALCLASTLDRLLVGMRPYWGPEDGPIHFTSVDHEARRLWTSLPRLASGRPGRRLIPEHGYVSRNAKEIRFGIDGAFVIDGELHEAREQEELVLTAPTVVRWVVPA